MDWLIWLAAGVVLGILELLSLDFVLLMLAVGCFAGTLVAIVDDDWVLPAVIAIVVAGAMLGLVRPLLIRRLQTGPDLKLGSQRLIGAQSLTSDEISDQRPGQLIIAGEQWTAQPYAEGTVIPPGTAVEVLAIKGATAYVHPLLSTLKEF